MFKSKFLYKVLNGILIVFSIVMIGCNSDEEIDSKLDAAEEIMEQRPDSALSILNSIDGLRISGGRAKARYALLKSMALDKNYIDTTTFDVLQPALEYYLKKGNADEKMKTLYYQGRIYRNAGEDDLAMQAYLTALQVNEKTEIYDTLTLARVYVAQGALFYKEYKIPEFIENNLKAGDLYGKLGMTLHQLKSYSKVLDGESRLKRTVGADTLYIRINRIIEDHPSLKAKAIKSLLVYSVNFDHEKDIKRLLESVRREDIKNDMKMTLARAYCKIGEPETGLRYLSEAKVGADDIFDSLTYWSVKTEILEQMGEYRESLDAFRNYSRLLETYHMKLFSNELLFSEKKHEMEVENMKRLQKKNEIILWISSGAVLLICVLGLLYYRYRLNRTGRLLAEQQAEKLRLENSNLELEREKLRLETENLNLTVGQLEEERERLNGLMEKQEQLSADMRRIIQERLEMLNGLFASEITKEKSHASEYRKFVDAIKKNKKKFLREIRKDLESTYPAFFSHISALGMTERETDYICLYAIGLRGKEIGNYLDVAGHYNISSEIRSKLGLESKGENLGPFIRKLMAEKGSRG